MSLSASEICALQVAMADVFTDNPNLFSPKVPTLQAVADKQRVSFSSFNAGVLNGCNFAKAIRLDSCDNVVGDCGDLADCDIGGNAPTSVAYDLVHNLCKTVDFTIDLSSCNNFYTPERLRAEMIAKHIGKIETALNNAILGTMVTNRETVAQASFPSPAPSGATSTVADGADIRVDLNKDLTAQDIGWLLAGADSECMTDPFFLSGGMMQAEYYQALAEDPACCNPETSTMRSGAVDVVFDTKNINTVIGADNNLLMVDPTVLAFWSANNFQNDTPQPWNDKNNTWVWRVQSPRIQFRSGGTLIPVYYDVMRQVTCNVGGGPNGHYPVEAYRIIFNGGFHTMPDPTCSGECPGTTTGIIHLANVA